MVSIVSDKLGWSVEQAGILIGAKEVWTNQKLLECNLPLTMALRRCGAKLNIISLPHCNLNEVHEPAKIEGFRSVVRPAEYGRAGIANISGEKNVVDWDWNNDIFVDVKGCGVRSATVPLNKSHCNGLMLLIEGIHEILMEEMISTLLALHEIEIGTVRNIALILTGIDATPEEYYGIGTKVPTVLLVREALPRFGTYSHSIADAKVIELTATVELILRQAGITSTKMLLAFKLSRTGPDEITVERSGYKSNVSRTDRQFMRLDELLAEEKEKKFRDTNVQFSFQIVDGAPMLARIVDFGHFNVGDFSNEGLVVGCLDAPNQFGPAICPDSAEWVAPNETATTLRKNLERSELEGLAALKYFRVDPKVLKYIDWFSLYCLSVAKSICEERNMIVNRSCIIASEVKRVHESVKQALSSKGV
jgi:hypothetical protein